MFDSSLSFIRRRDHKTYALVLSDKSDSGHKLVHKCGRGQYKASVVDISAPKNVVVSTEFTINKVKDSPVSKHKVFQSDLGQINIHIAGSLVIGKSTSDPVEIYEDKGRMDLAKCQSILFNNRYRVLEALWDDQASTFGCDSNTYNGVLKDTYLGTDFQMHYPSVDSLIWSLNEIGPSPHIFKVDISLAFRHICILGPLGPSEGVSLFKISRLKEPGPPIVFGGISHCPPLILLKYLMLLDLTSMPGLLSLPLLGVWGPVNIDIIIICN